MRDALTTFLRARPGTPLAELAEAELSREGELQAQREAGAAHELMAHAAELEAAAGQLRLELSGYDARGNVRLEVARYLETVVLPALPPEARLAMLPSAPAEGEAGEKPKRRRKTPLECVPLLPGKLREARRQCWFQMNMEDGGTRTLWDTKAGEPLLCPDDAREESQRLTRRLEGKIEELQRQGLRLYYGVLTIENAAPGHLAARVAKLWRKFQRALKAREPRRQCRPAPRLHVHAARTCTKKSWRHSLFCRRAAPMFRPPVRACARRVRAQRRLPAKQLKPLFPIVGALATLEAPLSASRTWHPHLNVILVTRGFFDFGAWWQHWGCVSDWRHLKPGSVDAAFRELVKYAVRAVPEKSAAKAAEASPCSTPPSPSSSASWPDMPPADPWTDTSAPASAAPPGAAAGMTGGESSGCSTGKRSRSAKAPAGPAMVEWTAAEWLEWWQAMKGRRRTRTYGELYGLNVEAEEEPGRWVTIGKGWWAGTGYRTRIELLECIPGDKSISNIRTRYEKWLQGLTHPPDYYRELARQVAAARDQIRFSALTP